jgi:hypothetical protein
LISSRDERLFIEDVISNDLLENTIAWISNNLEPDNVFSKEELEEWARSNGFVEEE